MPRGVSQQLVCRIPPSPCSSPGLSFRAQTPQPGTQNPAPAGVGLPSASAARVSTSSPGRHSSADQTLPSPSSPLRDLSVKLSHWLQSSGLGLKASIAAHIMQQKPDCPLSEALEQEALSIIINTLGLGNAESLTEVEPGQPLRLNLLQALATHIGDKGLALVPMLKAGVSTGVQEPVPSSFPWPKKAQRSRGRTDGPGPLAATAVGKLNLVEAPGKDPRASS